MRPYTAEDVLKLRGSVTIEYSLARNGAERLWQLLHSEEYVAGLGALTGNQAVQEVQAGLNAIYLSRLAGGGRRQQLPARCTPTRASTPPTRCRPWCAASTTPCSAPTRSRAYRGEGDVHWLVPIVADAEAGFRGQPERV